MGKHKGSARRWPAGLYWEDLSHETPQEGIYSLESRLRNLRQDKWGPSIRESRSVGVEG